MATTTATTIPLLLLSFLLLTSLSLTSSHRSSHRSSDVSFIHSSCKSTQYPHLCTLTLSSYATSVRHSPRTLASTALSVSLRHAKSACSLIDALPLSESVRSRGSRGAVKDCIEVMSDSVDRIRRSIGEMGHMGRAGSSRYAFHMSNVQTWVSAALTDENTCLDSMKGIGVDRRMKAAIRRKIVGVARVTSNALALVNKVAYKY